MRVYWVLGIAMASALSASARECTVAVYIRGDPMPPGLLPIAKLKSQAMFREIGVDVEWRHGATEAPRENDCGAPLVVEIHAVTPGNASPHALASASPYRTSGISIHVYLQRVLDTQGVMGAPYLLAHVLTHEITHVLENISRHSERGVMKANWTFADYGGMRSHPLPFAPEDVQMIHLGMARRMKLAASR